MTYGLSPGLFVENGPAVKAAEATLLRHSDAFRAWRSLDSERRLALVDEALRAPANDDGPDGFPLAL